MDPLLLFAAGALVLSSIKAPLKARALRGEGRLRDVGIALLYVIVAAGSLVCAAATWLLLLQKLFLG